MLVCLLLLMLFYGKQLEHLYALPEKIMFNGDFQEARAAAKADKKLLLVNIQSESEFKCHELNRDLWKVTWLMLTQFIQVHSDFEAVSLQS
jgi:thioredoxin-related protein